MYNIRIYNMEDKGYSQLLDLSFRYCDEFCIVVRKDMKINDKVNDVLRRLSPSLKTVREQNQWPGTMLWGSSTATVYYYSVDDDAKKILKEESKSLFEWVHPELPEDLSFLKNGKAWLINTAHERCVEIITECEEEIESVTSIEQLLIKVRKNHGDRQRD